METPEYVFPAAARVEKKIRFDRIDASARFGCAVSEAARDGVLRLTNAETARVTVNGEPVSAAGEITLRKGDRVVLTTENASAFHAAYAHDCLRAPGLETARESGVDWLLLALPTRRRASRSTCKRPISRTVSAASGAPRTAAMCAPISTPAFSASGSTR